VRIKRCTYECANTVVTTSHGIRHKSLIAPGTSHKSTTLHRVISENCCTGLPKERRVSKYVRKLEEMWKGSIGTTRLKINTAKTYERTTREERQQLRHHYGSPWRSLKSHWIQVPRVGQDRGCEMDVKAEINAAW